MTVARKHSRISYVKGSSDDVMPTLPKNLRFYFYRWWSFVFANQTRSFERGTPTKGRRYSLRPLHPPLAEYRLVRGECGKSHFRLALIHSFVATDLVRVVLATTTL
jgi:hypothetical protein